MSRTLNVILNVFSIGLVVAGSALLVAIFIPQLSMPDPTLKQGSPQVSQISNTVGDKSGSNSSGSASGEPSPVPTGVSSKASSEKAKETSGPKGPKNKTLKISIPAMNRVKDDSVPKTTGDDEKGLKKNVGVHLKGTGDPWQKEANVYIAGHRIGYPGTDSFLGFYDLNKLGKGDKIYVTDARGKKYTYRVFRQEIVRPTNTSVTKPIAGHNIMTLQTCTLPNYTQRLLVQAEKIS